MSAEWDLLCDLTAPNGSGTELPEDQPGQPVDWEHLWTIATRHSVGGYLADAFGAADSVPADVRTNVERAARERTARGLRMTDRLYDVLGELRSASVSAVPYKGPVLSVVTDGDPGAREYGDLDLFVHPNDFGEARDRLESRGYRTVERLRGLGEVALQASDGVTVDLHRSILPRQFPGTLSFEAVWNRRIQRDLGNGSVPALDPVDRLLVLAVHGVKHCWYRLAWVRDVAALFESDHADPQELRERARKHGCHRHVLVAARLADRVYEITPPSELVKEAADDTSVERLVNRLHERLETATAQPPSDAEQFSVQWRALARRRDRLRFAANVATTPTESDIDSVDLPDWLGSLYRVVRPARLIARYGRAGLRRLRSGPESG